MAKAKKRTKTKDTISVGVSRVFTESQRGAEPNFTEESSADDIQQAINWYSYFHDGIQAKTWLVEYMKSVKYDKSEIAKVKSSPWHKSGLEIRNGKIINLKFSGYIARMCMRGLKNLPESYANRMSDAIEFSIKMTDEKKSDNVVEKEDVLSIQEHIKTQVNILCADIEGAIDDFFDNNYQPTIDVYSWLSSKQIKGLIAKKIGEEFLPRLEEINDIDNDPDLKEGYRGFTQTQLKKYRTFLQSIVDDCDRYSANQNKQRKPRKKKPITVDKQVSKLNFKKEDSDFKVSSINPVEIIGAYQLWVFNTKYRKLGIYNSTSLHGLSVKGSAIQDFDSEKSVQKTLRKPEDILPKISSGGKLSAKKQFDSIKSKEQPLNGRINNETILLRVIK